LRGVKVPRRTLEGQKDNRKTKKEPGRRGIHKASKTITKKVTYKGQKEISDTGNRTPALSALHESDKS
jgi:hypothetical protein